MMLVIDSSTETPFGRRIYRPGATAQDLGDVVEVRSVRMNGSGQKTLSRQQLHNRRTFLEAWLDDTASHYSCCSEVGCQSIQRRNPSTSATLFRASNDLSAASGCGTLYNTMLVFPSSGTGRTTSTADTYHTKHSCDLTPSTSGRSEFDDARHS